MKLFTGLNGRIHVLYFDPARNWRENILPAKYSWGGMTSADMETAKFLLWFAVRVDDVKLANTFMMDVVCGLDPECGFSIADWQIQEWVKSKTESFH